MLFDLKTAQCPFCNKVGQISFLFTVQNPRSTGKERYNYVRCSRCGLAFLDPMPTDEDLDRIYTELYDLYEESSNTFQDKIANLLSKPREQYIDSIRKSPGRILDIGCGVGSFLQKMEERGWDVYGVEPTKWIREKAERRIGKDKISTEELHECHFPDTYFDVVTLWHVLEHIKNPNNLISEINRILKEHGFLIIEVPNLDSLSLRLFKDDYALSSVPVHVTYWGVSSLKLFLEKNNYHIEDIRYPLMMPLTFSKSFSRLVSEELNDFMGKIAFFLSIPLSVVNRAIGSLTDSGESIRICAKKGGT